MDDLLQNSTKISNVPHYRFLAWYLSNDKNWGLDKRIRWIVDENQPILINICKQLLPFINFDKKYTMFYSEYQFDSGNYDDKDIIQLKSETIDKLMNESIIINDIQIKLDELLYILFKLEIDYLYNRLCLLLGYLFHGTGKLLSCNLYEKINNNIFEDIFVCQWIFPERSKLTQYKIIPKMINSMNDPEKKVEYEKFNKSLWQIIMPNADYKFDTYMKELERIKNFFAIIKVQNIINPACAKAIVNLFKNTEKLNSLNSVLFAIKKETSKEYLKDLLKDPSFKIIFEALKNKSFDEIDDEYKMELYSNPEFNNLGAPFNKLGYFKSVYYNPVFIPNDIKEEYSPILIKYNSNYDQVKKVITDANIQNVVYIKYYHIYRLFYDIIKENINKFNNSFWLAVFTIQIFEKNPSGTRRSYC